MRWRHFTSMGIIAPQPCTAEPKPFHLRRPIASVDTPQERQALAAFMASALQQLQGGSQQRQRHTGHSAGSTTGSGRSSGQRGLRTLSSPETALALARGPGPGLGHARSMSSISEASSSSGRLDLSSPPAALPGAIELGTPVQREWVLHCRPLQPDRPAVLVGGRPCHLEHRMYVQAAAGELRVATTLVNDRGL